MNELQQIWELLGSAGLGYAKDRFSAEDLQKNAPAAYESFKAEKPSSFLFLSPVNGLDGTKLREQRREKFLAMGTRGL